MPLKYSQEFEPSSPPTSSSPPQIFSSPQMSQSSEASDTMSTDDVDELCDDVEVRANSLGVMVEMRINITGA